MKKNSYDEDDDAKGLQKLIKRHAVCNMLSCVQFDSLTRKKDPPPLLSGEREELVLSTLLTSILY